MSAGPPLLTFLTLIGLALMASGAVIRVMAFRRALLFAPAPVPVPTRWGPAQLPVPTGGTGWRQRVATRLPAEDLAPERETPERQAPGRPVPPELPPLRRRILTPSRLLFLGCFALYISLGAVLALHYGSAVGDVQSRVSNAYYVLFSRDPHLAAIGFFWSPLPSLLYIPLLPFKALWPALTKDAFVANLESALFMAGAVCVMRNIVSDLRLPRGVSVIIVGAFALNPMTLNYGANGMSEALFILTLLLATRYLIQWLDTDRLRGLAFAGTWVGIAYLVRYEAFAAGVAVITLVAARTFWRTVAPRRQRLLAAAADTVIVGVPFAAAFVGWAVTSFIIVGHPFDNLSSEWIAKVSTSGAFAGKGIGWMAVQVLSYAPLLVLILAGAGARAWPARDLRFLAPVAVLGSVLAFNVLGFFVRAVGTSYRYRMAALPMALVLVACLLAGRSHIRHETRPSRWRLGRRWTIPSTARPVMAAAVAVVLVGPALPATAWVMSNPRFGPEEHQHLSWVVKGRRGVPAGEREWEIGPVARKIARYLDDQNLPKGSILADTFTSCVSHIVLASRRPSQFVITSDRDFDRTLNDPLTFKARYILVPPNQGRDAVNAVNRIYPTLYEEGAGLAKFVREFTAPACPSSPHLRLYELTGSPSTDSQQNAPFRGGR